MYKMIAYVQNGLILNAKKEKSVWNSQRGYFPCVKNNFKKSIIRQNQERYGNVQGKVKIPKQKFQKLNTCNFEIKIYMAKKRLAIVEERKIFRTKQAK